MLAEVAKPDVGACTSDSCPRGEIRSVPWDGGGDGKRGARCVLPPSGPGQVRPPRERETGAEA